MLYITAFLEGLTTVLVLEVKLLCVKVCLKPATLRRICDYLQIIPDNRGNSRKFALENSMQGVFASMGFFFFLPPQGKISAYCHFYCHFPITRIDKEIKSTVQSGACTVFVQSLKKQLQSVIYITKPKI